VFQWELENDQQEIFSPAGRKKRCAQMAPPSGMSVKSALQESISGGMKGAVDLRAGEKGRERGNTGGKTFKNDKS